MRVQFNECALSLSLSLLGRYNKSRILVHLFTLAVFLEDIYIVVELLYTTPLLTFFSAFHFHS